MKHIFQSGTVFFHGASECMMYCLIVLISASKAPCTQQLHQSGRSALKEYLPSTTTTDRRWTDAKSSISHGRIKYFPLLTPTQLSDPKISKEIS